MSTANLPISSEAVPNRVVIRCKECRLNQFLTRNGLCRKCRHELIEKPKEEIKPVVVEVWRPNHSGLRKAVALTFRLIRLVLGKSQRDMASISKLPRSYWSKLENCNALPTVGQLERLCGFLEISVYGFVLIAERLA
jgi:hypothetical protein